MKPQQREQLFTRYFGGGHMFYTGTSPAAPSAIGYGAFVPNYA